MCRTSLFVPFGFCLARVRRTYLQFNGLSLQSVCVPHFPRSSCRVRPRYTIDINRSTMSAYTSEHAPSAASPVDVGLAIQYAGVYYV